MTDDNDDNRSSLSNQFTSLQSELDNARKEIEDLHQQLKHAKDEIEEVKADRDKCKSDTEDSQRVAQGYLEQLTALSQKQVEPDNSLLADQNLVIETLKKENERLIDLHQRRLNELQRILRHCTKTTSSGGLNAKQARHNVGVALDLVKQWGGKPSQLGQGPIGKVDPDLLE